MKVNAFALAIVALALGGLGSSRTVAAASQADRITIPGTVVSTDHETLVVRTDDHGHRMAFDVKPATSLPDGLRRGAHVAVTYHPLGPTGQAADEVQVVERGAFVRSQAAFKVVAGRPDEIRVGAR